MAAELLPAEPERRARRRTLILLACAALLSAMVAVAFVFIWRSYVASLEPQYFREQGIQWGRDFQSRIRGSTMRFLARARPFEVEDWPRHLNRHLSMELESLFARNPALKPRRIVVRFKKTESAPFTSAVAIGPELKTQPPGGAYVHDNASEFDIAVVRGERRVTVLVDGPIHQLEQPMQERVAFSLVIEFLPFNLMAERGTAYAVGLVTVYLLLIYGLFILVFRFGRRQLELAFSAKEKSIRLKAISSVAEGIAHEVRNPLNAISLNVQYLEKLGDIPDHVPKSGDYQRIYRELGKIRKVIDNFVNFAKSRDLIIESFAMTEAVDDALHQVRERLEELEVQVERDDAPDTWIDGDRPRLAQVVLNVVENALDALENETERSLDIQLTSTQKSITLAIQNRGETPDDEIIRNMFDPYYTTRQSSLGLGLTLAKTIVESHGGVILARAAPGGGLVVTMTLPREF